MADELSYPIENDETIELLKQYLLQQKYELFGIRKGYVTYLNNSQVAVKYSFCTEHKDAKVFPDNIKEGNLEKITWILEHQSEIRPLTAEEKIKFFQERQKTLKE